MKRFAFSLVVLLAGAAGCIIPPQGGAGAGAPAYASSGGGAAPSGGGSSGGYEAQPAAAGGGGEASAPAAPAVVSIDLHNDCPHDVKLFLGQDPKFGSGTHTSLESNSTESFSLKPGDMIWIEDDSENGISSMSASPGQTNMRVLPSCSGFGPS